MSFLTDVQELKSGLIIFRRTDVDHSNWYCRVKVPHNARKYKTISLKTPNEREARDMAFEHDADIRFRLKHEVPVFEKTFAEVALEYSAYQKRNAEAGQITIDRWKTVDLHIRRHLIPYAGHLQVTHITETHWQEYPFWRRQRHVPSKDADAYGRRKKTATGPTGAKSDKAAKPHVPPKDGTIRQEMNSFRAVMNFAASKQYIRERQVPKGKLPIDKGRREAFAPNEYRALHTQARSQWLGKGDTELNNWYREMTYYFILIMANTGMRTVEARGLRWRDIDVRKDKHDREFAALSVQGKKKYRELVAASNVVDYLDRLKRISKATQPDDFVFPNYEGNSALDNYRAHIEDLLTTTGLLYTSAGSRRSAYSLRHTYATFRLMEGVDVYFLAKQMGTSVKMIEDYYGHITPAKNAERILQGLPGWEPITEAPGDRSEDANASGIAKPGARRSRAKSPPAPKK